jgi:hypothetical protein
MGSILSITKTHKLCLDGKGLDECREQLDLN